MADFDLYDDLYIFHLPELVLILGGIIRTSERPEERHILDVATLALSRVQAAMGTEDAYRVGATPSPTRRKATAVDAEVDRLISDLYRQLGAIARSRHHAAAASAEALLHQAFPFGLKHHTHARWDDKRSMNRTLMGKLLREDHASLLQGVGLQPIVDQLGTLSGQFEASLVAVDLPSRVEIGEHLRHAREAASWAIATVRAAWDPQDAEGGQRRDAMLAELRGVQARLRARYARGPRKDQPRAPKTGGDAGPGTAVGEAGT